MLATVFESSIRSSKDSRDIYLAIENLRNNSITDTWITSQIVWFCVAEVILDFLSLIFQTQDHANNKGVCYAQAINLQFFSVACWLWITSIGVAMYFIIVKNVKNLRT
jgi:hypothetical protein